MYPPLVEVHAQIQEESKHFKKMPHRLNSIFYSIA